MTSFEPLRCNDSSVVSFYAYCRNGDDANRLATALQRNTHLRELRLRVSGQAPVSDKDSQTLADAIRKTRIVKLDMTWATGKREGLANAVLHAVKDSPTIQELELSIFPLFEKFGDIHLLIQCLPKLTSLTVTRSSSSTEKLELLWQGLHLTSTLTKLVVKGDPLNAVDMRLLSQGIANNSSISTLCLSRCGVDDEGLDSFVHQWRHDSTIHTLDLSENKISGAAALRLIQAASRRPFMQHLNLNANAIGIEGLVNIAFELPKIVLKELKLACDSGVCISRNSSNDRSLHAILASKVVLQGLKDNKYLVAFDVSGHGFETCARGFQETLDSYLMRNRCAPLTTMAWSSPVPRQAFHLPRGIWSHVFGKFEHSDGVFLYFMWPQNGETTAITARLSGRSPNSKVDSFV